MSKHDLPRTKGYKVANKKYNPQVAAHSYFQVMDNDEFWELLRLIDTQLGDSVTAWERATIVEALKGVRYGTEGM